MEKLEMDNESELHLAAVYTSDRRRLFEFVSPGQRQTQYSASGRDVGRTDLQFSYGDQAQTDMVISIDDGPAILSDMELLEIDLSVEDDTEIEDVVSDEAEHMDIGLVIEKQEVDMEEAEQSDSSGIPAIDMIEESEDSENRGIEVDGDTEDSVPGGEGGNLIERFIKKDPGAIRADAKSSLKGDASVESVRESDHLITDTLAKIYLKQGLHAKAIYSYEKLSLKFPEKSAYFAAQIEKIENITNS
jgi:hypothetical protein